jgi:hypothetical protein
MPKYQLVSQGEEKWSTLIEKPVLRGTFRSGVDRTVSYRWIPILSEGFHP